MIESIGLIIWFLVGMNIIDNAVVPAAKDVNTTYVKPTIEYTKDKVGDGVDYITEKLN